MQQQWDKSDSDRGRKNGGGGGGSGGGGGKLSSFGGICSGSYVAITG